jgi:hypothetical protein
MKVTIQWKSRVIPPPEFDVPRKPQLNYPFDPVPKTALLGLSLNSTDGVREFAAGWSPELARFAPEALAAPARTIQWLIRAVDDGRVSIPPLSSSVIAFVGEPYGRLTLTDRELIDKLWGVPVFEQLRSPSGDLLAVECPAHRGLHICNSLMNLNDALLQFESIDRSPCLCGSSVPRLMGIDQPRSMAAAR